jgi:hypothetical protein
MDNHPGITWWNSLTERERAYWLQQAGSAVPGDAWTAYLKTLPGGDSRSGSTSGP